MATKIKITDEGVEIETENPDLTYVARLGHELWEGTRPTERAPVGFAVTPTEAKSDE